eukprot:Phypoly_transcript_11128.p1 GENE.Phypoly_transcript_11128~~Phypoly_transcript_11128.p1  ORF type:complete len:287 (-),score=36.80 Phypoly_transcript_11128:254-1114(-)
MFQKGLVFVAGFTFVFFSVSILLLVFSQIKALTAEIERLSVMQLPLEEMKMDLYALEFSFSNQVDMDPEDRNLVDIFYKSSKTLGTDKVTAHRYELMYGKYIPFLRGREKLKMLEVGYGCGFSNPGGSARVWRAVFGSKLELHMIEFDGKCVETYKSNITQLGVNIYVGDQSSRKFLQEVITKSGGNFDMIIDDGGHTMEQQRTSVEELFSAVKPGGFYAIEDMHTSNFDAYRDHNGYPLTTTVVKGYVDLLMGFSMNASNFVDEKNGGNAAYVNSIQSFECMKEM